MSIIRSLPGQIALQAKELFAGSKSRSEAGECEVCGGKSAATGNSLVTCTTCQLVVHQKCYDIQTVPDQYQCDECAIRQDNIEIWGVDEKDSDEPDCALCPVPKQCLRGLKPLVTKARKRNAAHAICAALIPGSIIQGGRIDLTAVDDKWEGWTADCQVCKAKSLGTCIQCTFPDCYVAAHASCAMSPSASASGYELHFDGLPQSERMKLNTKFRCPGHSNFASKHPEKADLFLKRVAALAPNLVSSTMGAAASAELLKGSKKKGPAMGPTNAPTLVQAQKTLLSAGGASAFRSSRAPKGPAPKPDPTWINRRVSVFLESVIGTVTKIKRNKFVVALDDGIAELERRADELRLIPIREPGCQVCHIKEGEVIQCDGCDCENHLHCAEPHLTSVPEGKWFCSDCLKEQRAMAEEALAVAEAEFANSAASGARGGGSAKRSKTTNGAKRLDESVLSQGGDDQEPQTMDENGEEGGDEEQPKTAAKPAPRKRNRQPQGGEASAAATTAAAAAAPKPRKSAISGNAAGFNDIKEENVDFESLFHDYTAKNWQTLFVELFRVQRAETVTFMSRFGLRDVADELCKSNSFTSSKKLCQVLCKKVFSQELPKACADGFLNAVMEEARNTHVKLTWTSDEINAIKQACSNASEALDMSLIGGNDENGVTGPVILNYQPWCLSHVATTPRSVTTTTMEGSEDIASAVMVPDEQVLLKQCEEVCEKSLEHLISVNLSAVLVKCYSKKSEISDLTRFLELFLELADKLRLDCERTFSRAILPSFRTRDLFRKLEVRLRTIRVSEPVSKGEWRKSPYPRRAYETISDYEPAAIPGESAKEERDRIFKKLETSKKPNCDEREEECSKLAPYSLALNGFETERPCLSRRVGCKASTIGKNMPLVLKRDLVEYDSWGFDGATRRFMDAVLEVVAGIRSPSVQNSLIEGFLLRCVNANDASEAFDINKALDYGIRAIQASLKLGEDFATLTSEQLEQASLLIKNSLIFSKPTVQTPVAAAAAAAAAVIQAQQTDQQDGGAKSSSSSSSLISNITTPLDLLRGFQALKLASKIFEFQIRPKGVGIKCEIKAGFKAGTFISRYLGELYTPWRWFEKQDGVKLAQSKTGFKPSLPDFYNIMLERHLDDPDGYDVLFVDPIVRGNFASRLCHSCDPNCATVVMAVNGRFVIAVYALRDVAYGEELTFDYSSVTEDENEFRAAICLCGSSNCRGSFLYFAGTGSFASVIGTHHTFLDRVAILFESSREFEILPEEDEERLQKHGILKSVLRDLPLWMNKWAVLILKFVDFETEQLARELVNPSLKNSTTGGGGNSKFGRGANFYTEESARIEAGGVAENRRQNVAITSNKLEYFLRKSQSQEHPLRELNEEETLDFLWNAKTSVAWRAIDACAMKRDELNDPPKELVDLIDSLEKFMNKNKKAKSKEDARRLLTELRDKFWGCALNDSYPWCESCGDVLLMHALTETWFTSTSYKGFKSPNVAIRNVDIGRDASATSAPANNSASSSLASASTPAAFQNNTFPLPVEEVFAIRVGFDPVSGSLQIDKEERMDSSEEMEVLEEMQRLFVFASPVALPSPALQSGSGAAAAGGAGLPTAVATATQPFYVYQSMRDSRVVLSLFALDSTRYLLKFAFHAFPATVVIPTQLTSVLSLFSFPQVQEDNSDLDFFGISEKQLKRAKFVGAPSAAASSGASAAVADAGDDKAAQNPEAEQKMSAQAMKVIYNEPKKYQSGFVWGQMIGWFKQTVSDPSASLSAERRGSLSLPDVESCFKSSDLQDFLKCRKDMLKKIKEKPDGMWPVNWPYSFKNKEKIYGSPWFDDALETARAGDFVRRNDRSSRFIQTMHDHMGIVSSSATTATTNAADAGVGSTDAMDVVSGSAGMDGNEDVAMGEVPEQSPSPDASL